MFNTWGDESAVGGGFFNAANQFENVNTPNQAQKSAKRSSRTARIVIRQALHSGDDGIKIWGTEIQIVSVVGLVTAIREQSTLIKYTIQDITGTMPALFWIQQDEDDNNAVPKIKLNEYVQIYGNIKSNQGPKVIMIFKITPITDVNEITFHYLLCIQNKLKMEAEYKKVKTANPNTSNFKNALPANSMVGISETITPGLNPRQMMVLSLIRSSIAEQGISKQDISAALKDRMGQTELENILEWMSGEGHIYSTIDEEHFRATDDA